jgi:MscS family membrane protein
MFTISTSQKNRTYQTFSYLEYLPSVPTRLSFPQNHPLIYFMVISSSILFPLLGWAQTNTQGKQKTHGESPHLTLLESLQQPLDLLSYIKSHLLLHYHQYLYAFLSILFVLICRRLLINSICNRMFKWVEKSTNKVDDLTLKAIRKPLNTSLILLGIWIAYLFLSSEVQGIEPVFTGHTIYILSKFLSLIWFLILGWVGLNFCDVFSHLMMHMAEQTETRMDDMLIPVLRRSLKIFIVLITLILLIQNWGYSISALLAGFSIGGVAIALASQDMLQNLFGSLMIFVDRPFQIGDWITVGSIEGVVEEVGMRSTRIRTFAETLITVPNHKIAHEPINNYSRMPKRRVKQTIGVGYNTDPDRLEAVIQSLRAILQKNSNVDQQFWMVNFNEFADSSLNILVYYFTNTTQWAEFMKIRQDISLEFMRAIDELGVEIAFPTRTLYLRSDEEPIKPDLTTMEHIYNPRSDSPPAPLSSDMGEMDGEG